jgi:Putative prokaryotic signal transducing protein
MSEEKYVVVAAFTFLEEAQIACGRLEAEGISARVTSDVPSAFYGFSGMGRVELYVPTSDAERAAGILAECMHEEEFDADPIRSPEKQKPIWVCSLCGDAVSVEETVCSACGTSREALQPAKSENLHENRPRQRVDLQREKPALPESSVEADFEVPALEYFNKGDVIAGRAMKAALVNLLVWPMGCTSLAGSVCTVIPFALVAYGLLIQLLFYQGELSPSGMRKFYIALAIDLVLPILFGILFLSMFSHRV